MGLTNVWRKQSSGEWVRTSEAEARRIFPYTVSARDERLRCNICYQYVTFRKKEGKFWHSRGEEDKSCDDRSRSSTSGIPLTHETLYLPLKVQYREGKIACYVGFPPVKNLNNLQQSGFSIRLYSGTRSSTYFVDHSRFSEHETTWLDIDSDWLFSFGINYSPDHLRPQRWSQRIPSEPDFGFLFDAKTGQQIPGDGDVLPNHDYLLVRSHDLKWVEMPDIEIERLTERAPFVFRIQATCYSDLASNFFFMKLKMRLTKDPTDLILSWPPALVRDNLIETNCRHLWITLQGEADLDTVPEGFIRQYIDGADEKKLVELLHDGTLSMISAGRYGGNLAHFFVDALTESTLAKHPSLTLTDRNGRHIVDDHINSLPVDGIIRVTTEVDGFADVSNQDGILYRHKLNSGVEELLTDLCYGMTITFRLGLDIVRTISFVKPSRSMAEIPYKDWTLQLVPFPKRYAAVLRAIPKNSPLYKRVYMALKRGKIPKDGLVQLRQMMEG